MIAHDSLKAKVLRDLREQRVAWSSHDSFGVTGRSGLPEGTQVLRSLWERRFEFTDKTNSLYRSRVLRSDVPVEAASSISRKNKHCASHVFLYLQTKSRAFTPLFGEGDVPGREAAVRREQSVSQQRCLAAIGMNWVALAGQDTSSEVRRSFNKIWFLKKATLDELELFGKKDSHAEPTGPDCFRFIGPRSLLADDKVECVETAPVLSGFTKQIFFRESLGRESIETQWPPT